MLLSFFISFHPWSWCVVLITLFYLTLFCFGLLFFTFFRQATTIRVKTAAQVAPLLLRRYFQIVLTEADASSVVELAPAMLERLTQLYSMEPFGAEIRQVGRKRKNE